MKCSSRFLLLMFITMLCCISAGIASARKGKATIDGKKLIGLTYSTLLKFTFHGLTPFAFPSKSPVVKVRTISTECWGLTVTGNMMIDIKIYVKTHDDLGNTTLAHEQHHEATAKGLWNALANQLNKAESDLKWCNQSCAKKWAKIGNTSYESMNIHRQIKDLEFDFKAYGKLISSRKDLLQNHNIKLQNLKTAHAAKESEFQTAYWDYVNSDCDNQPCK